jgi:hypothetical protein
MLSKGEALQKEGRIDRNGRALTKAGKAYPTHAAKSSAMQT